MARARRPSGRPRGVAGGVLALSQLLTDRFRLPGIDARRAEVILENDFGQRSTWALAVVAADALRPLDGLGGVPRLGPRSERRASRRTRPGQRLGHRAGADIPHASGD